MVALRAGDGLQVAENDRGSAIPGEVVPPAAEHPRGVGAQVLDQAPQGRRDALTRRPARGRLLAAAEEDEVRPLGRRQPQSARDPLEHVERRAHVAPLLEPRVPSRAHAGQLSDLLAPQAGGAAPSSVREADILGLEARAAVAQEVGQLVAAFGGKRLYQDKPLSCTWIESIAHCSP